MLSHPGIAGPFGGVYPERSRTDSDAAGLDQDERVSARNGSPEDRPASLNQSSEVRKPDEGLALRVLRRLAGSLESDLLSLFLTRIPGEQLRALQRAAKFPVEARQCSGYAVTDSSGLA